MPHFHLSRGLNSNEAALSIPDVEVAGGRSTLEYGHSQHTIVGHFLHPIIELQKAEVRAQGHPELEPLLLRYAMFRLAAGMRRPVQMDGVWKVSSGSYDPFLANILSRTEWYALQRCTRVDLTNLLEDCNDVWEQSWVPGAAMAVDEAIIPFKGLRAGHLRQFIPRKPHSTGLKLYNICDSGWAYTYDMYLYTGKRGSLRRRSTVSGSLNPGGIILRAANLLPSSTLIVADTYFGSLELAEKLAARCPPHPFLFLLKRNTPNVKAWGADVPAGSIGEAVDPEQKIALAIYKNPKVGGKPARIVPMVTNCTFGSEWKSHRRGYMLPGPIHGYRQLAGGVDTANQLNLQHREVGRSSTWARATRRFILRTAVVNAFVSCKQLRVIASDNTLFEFQWATIRYFCGEATVDRQPKVVHVPVPGASVRCTHCRKGPTTWVCNGCGLPLHIKCFGPAHAVVPDLVPDD